MTCVGTMKPLTAWSSRFSRSKQFEPPEGGTPNQHKFMESPLSLFRMHWDHEPRQLVGRGVLTAPRLGGLGTARPTLRFMETHQTPSINCFSFGSSPNDRPQHGRSLGCFQTAQVFVEPIGENLHVVGHFLPAVVLAFT